MSQDLDECNLFVKYLPANVNDEQLQQLFEPFGQIVSAKVMVDHVDGHSLGYGFVRFRTPEQAARAIQLMSGFKIENKKLLCKLSNIHSGVYSNNTEVSTNLYVKPLPINTTDEDLRRVFSQFGEIVECKVMVDRQTQTSRQIGFVRFAEQHCATAALEAMNGAHLDPELKGAPLIVRYAESLTQKAARRARKAARMMRAAPNSQEQPVPPPSRFFPVRDGFPIYDPYAASPPTMFNPPPMFGSPPPSALHPHPHAHPHQPIVYSSSPTGPFPYQSQAPFMMSRGGGMHEDFLVQGSPPHPFPQMQPSPYAGYPPPHLGGPVMEHAPHPMAHPHPQPIPPSEYMPMPPSALAGEAMVPDVTAADGQEPQQEGMVMMQPPQMHGMISPSAPINIAGRADPSQAVPMMPGSPSHPIPYPSGSPSGPRTISAPISTGVQLSTSPIHYYISPGYQPYPYYPEPSSPTPSECNNLFVFHLPGDADDSVLRALFEPFGAIESVKVIADKVTKKSRGYGFVKFHHVEDAKKAVQAMNGFALENKHLKVSFKTPPAASYSNLMSSSFERRVADFALCSSGDEAPSADDV